MPVTHSVSAFGTRRAAARRIPKDASAGPVIDLRKTSLLRDRSDGPAVKRSRQALVPPTSCVTTRRRHGRPCGRPLHKCRSMRSVARRFAATPDELGAISSSRCQTTRAAARWPPTRNFTLLDEPAPSLVVPFDEVERTRAWWSQTGSNRRPPACKAGALPAELWPQEANSDLRVANSAGHSAAATSEPIRHSPFATR